MTTSCSASVCFFLSSFLFLSFRLLRASRRPKPWSQQQESAVVLWLFFFFWYFPMINVFVTQLACSHTRIAALSAPSASTSTRGYMMMRRAGLFVSVIECRMEVEGWQCLFSVPQSNSTSTFAFLVLLFFFFFRRRSILRYIYLGVMGVLDEVNEIRMHAYEVEVRRRMAVAAIYRRRKHSSLCSTEYE